VWYIDSWAVLDGLAFASERDPESLQAKGTVFLSVPDLEPVPVGRLSTALRAQRSGFQDGFRDDKGDEIEFTSLNQVRDLVRRAYLGGGLGPEPAPLESRPVDPLLRTPGGEERPVELPPDGAPHYWSHLHKVDKHGPDGSRALLRTDFSPLAAPGTRGEFLRKLYEGPYALALYPFLQAFGEASVHELVRRGGAMPRFEVRALLRDWIAALWCIGLWNPHEDPNFHAFLDRYGSYPGWVGIDWRYLELLPAGRRQSMLFRIPCPLLPGWDVHIRSLSHKILLALTLRDYFKINSGLAEFIPILLCSLVVAVGNDDLPNRWGYELNSDRQRLLGRAFHWLKNELPSVELPPEAEDHLSRFAVQQLERNS
jgi:hypothetical protein